MNRYEIPYRPYKGSSLDSGPTSTRLRRLASVRTSGLGRSWYSVVGGSFNIGPVWTDEDAALTILRAKAGIDTSAPSTLYVFQAGQWNVVLRSGVTQPSAAPAIYDIRSSPPTSIQARVGDTFLLRADFSGSTGYAWGVDPPTPAGVLSVDVDHPVVTTPTVPAGVVGYSSLVDYPVHALSPGVAKLHAALMSPGGVAVRDVTIVVTVS